jgi:uncharacterized membrane protein YeaQ/YmgE (transglycosylase-associated protein family)
MTDQDLIEIKWTAAFAGFGVDWLFSELIGLGVTTLMLSIKGIGLDSTEAIPVDVVLARQFVGVVGAVVGGVVAGYLARRRGSLHGVLGSVIGLIVFFCSIPLLADLTLNIGDLGFVVLNLVGAGYGGKMGEQWRARREGDG